MENALSKARGIKIDEIYDLKGRRRRGRRAGPGRLSSGKPALSYRLPLFCRNLPGSFVDRRAIKAQDPRHYTGTRKDLDLRWVYAGP
jgi:hypothetical protein